MRQLVTALGIAIVALYFAASPAVAQVRWLPVQGKPNCEVWTVIRESKVVVTWTGGCANGKAEGRGKLVFRFLTNGHWQEDSFTGVVRGGRAVGQGQFTASNGFTYKGGWKDERGHGKGVAKWPNGDRYEGHWRNGKHHGNGIFVWSNGNRYEGEWQNRLYHGRGTLVWKDGRRYVGEFRKGRLYGRGVYVQANGEMHEGHFKNGLAHGLGARAFGNDSLCEGNWVNGKLVGFGTGWEEGGIAQCRMVDGKIAFLD